MMTKFLLSLLLIATTVTALGQPAVIEIRVVVHILYNTSYQNISDAQVLSQIAVLNKDYRGSNVDRAKTPAYFAPLAGDAGFHFSLATTDPSGHISAGVVRTKTNIQVFGLDDRIKKAEKGGDAAWDPRKYLNIWVGNLAGGVIGYTSKTGDPANMEGVVINTNAFGTMGTAGAPYNLGRTATHEIGHWLNLKHIWGDEYCGDDGIDDTPQQRASNRGTPTGEKFSCGTTPHGDMYMNFMDLTDDASMYMFTQGQVQRMRALFAPGGSRVSMISAESSSKPLQMIPAVTIPASVVVEETSFSVFPNPAHSFVQITIRNYDGNEPTPLTVFNLVGQPVINVSVTGGSQAISIGQLPAGSYYVRIIADGKSFTSKFVKN